LRIWQLNSAENWPARRSNLKEPYDQECGVIGYGYWGPNIVRIFTRTKDRKWSWFATRAPNARNGSTKRTPRFKFTRREYVLKSPTLIWLLCDSSVDALRVGESGAGKWQAHFRGKTFTCSTQQLKNWLSWQTARTENYGGHTFCLPSGQEDSPDVWTTGTGRPLLLRFTAGEFGIVSARRERYLDLAPHDLSIMDHVIKEKAERLSPPAKST